ncbi:hypothetical protein FV222_08900 [Methylobacterium sp. WL103]|uniref:hypothetical protein n=1 Tax=Methylobacterium sp. WL103 TaxID=2603891 RepID=UPI0011C7AC61|nr:hypothetical protein [Methylobacterium sp. WL103]TXN03069.1 hypothetical protein FV222_08900 [Methylobacterium sp. WL103]
MMDGVGLLDFAKVVIGAGLGSGVATLVLAWRKHRADGTYLAMRLAVNFEAYAKACATFVSENEHPEHRPDEEFPDWITTLPGQPDLPDDADGWKALNANDASAVLGFSMAIKDAQSVIDAIVEYTPDGIGDSAQEEAAKLGLQAWEIADRLRSAHKLDPVTLRFDYVAQLRRQVAIASQRSREEHLRQHQRLDEIYQEPR